MKILIYGINFHPELTGIGKYTGEMAQYLAENGHAVRVVTAPPYYPHWKKAAGYSGWRYQREQWEKIEVYRCPLWVPANPSGLKRMLHLVSFALSSFPALLSQAKWKPAVVITIAPAFFSAPNALALSWLTGSRTWLHIQDFELDAAFELGLLPGGKMLYPIARRIETALLKRFDGVSTISNRMLDRLRQKGIDKEHIVLFTNWIDTDLIYPLSQPSPLRRVWNIPDDQVVILYAGNMGNKQGLEIILNSARLLADEPKILFIFCGEGAVRAQLQEEAQDLPNLHFFPLQPQEQLNNLLNLADIHVLPQRADAADLVMPSKLSGMLASGKPVIATTNEETEIAQVLSSVGKVVPPENAEALVEAILILAKDRELRTRFGALGRSYAEEHWGKEMILRNFQECIVERAG